MSTKTYRALIIEDDPRLGEIFSMALQNAGFETYLDPDGDRYQAFLENNCPDLILLDMHLPFASGAEIARDIRENGLCPGALIVVATADLHVNKDNLPHADEVLIKPVQVNRLMNLAERIKQGE